MDDAVDSMATATRFAGLARKTDPSDYELVIHAAYYAMHHAARAAILAAKGSAPTNHGRVASTFTAFARQYDADRGLQQGRALRAAYDLRIISDYGRSRRDLTGDAANLRHQMEEFIDFCQDVVTACDQGHP